MTTIDSAAAERTTGKPSGLGATQSVIARLKARRWLPILEDAGRTAGGIEHEATRMITEKEAS